MDSKDQSLIAGFIGEKKRDASSGIRGFVYQNLITIEELIGEKTKRIFCEYIMMEIVKSYRQSTILLHFPLVCTKMCSEKCIVNI